MPTAAKLAAAVLFAALAWGVSQLVIPYVFEEGQSPGRFAEINAAIGLVLGWRLGGTRVRTSWPAAIGNGITATVAILVVTVFVHSFVVMIRQSLKKLYDGPVEALVGVFQLMTHNALVLMHGEVIAALVAGAVLAGILIEWCGRNFR